MLVVTVLPLEAIRKKRNVLTVAKSGELPY